MKTTLAAVQSSISQFLRAHKRELAGIDFVVGVSRGGLIPAALIATAMDKPLVTAYIDRQDNVYLDRADWIKRKRLLLVDDIVRTGSTFAKMHAMLERHDPKSIQSFTLFCLRGASIRPTWSHMVAKDRVMPWDMKRRH